MTTQDTAGARWARVPLNWIPRIPGSAQARVLIALLSHKNAKTERCDPAVSTLATEAGVSSRGVRRALRDLEKAGLLIIDRQPGTSSAYRFPPDKIVSTDRTVTPDTSDMGGVTEVSVLPLTVLVPTPDRTVTQTEEQPIQQPKEQNYDVVSISKKKKVKKPKATGDAIVEKLVALCVTRKHARSCFRLAPDVAKAWLEADLDAQLGWADDRVRALNAKIRDREPPKVISTAKVRDVTEFDSTFNVTVVGAAS